MIQDINDGNFKAETDQGITLVDFWATWCPPCKMQSPILEKLNDEMTDVNFRKIDVDQNPKTATEFGIMSIPTLLIKKDGKVVEKLIGLHTGDQLKSVLSKYTV